MSEAAPAAAASAAVAAITTPPAGGDTAFINTFPKNVREFVTNKGWKNNTDLLTGYQNLETKLGSARVALPKDGDAAGEAEFRKAIGVPEAADKYEIKLPDGASIDEAFLKTAKGWMHEAGLTPKQAQLIASKWNDFTSESLKTAAQGKLQASEQGLKDVEKEWGSQSDANKAAAQRAFKAVTKAAGLEAADLEAIEETIGAQKMLKMFAFFGSTTSEARFVDGSRTPGSHLTPEAARARMAELRTDREWFARMNAGGLAENNEWKNLLAIIGQAA